MLSGLEPASPPGCLGAQANSMLAERPNSAALELWFAFLVEGQDAFAAVFRVDELIVGLDLEAVSGADLHLAAVADRFLRLPGGEGCVGGDHLRRVECRLQHGTGLAQAVDQSPCVCLLGRKRPGGEDDLLGASLTDRARQVLGAAGAGDDAQ